MFEVGYTGSFLAIRLWRGFEAAPNSMAKTYSAFQPHFLSYKMLNDRLIFVKIDLSFHFAVSGSLLSRL